MVTAASNEITGMILAALILLAAYALIFSEVMHRASAAVIGAVVMVGVGSWAGFYSQEQAVSAIDGNTMFLLSGMMMMVAMLKPTGGFEYLAIRLAKVSNSPRRLLVYLGLAVSVISMFLDNVTTVIIFAPLTVLISRILEVNPMPYLMAEAMLSNIGGIATLVGDPPNIMIGSAAGIDFNRFFLHMGPVVALVWIAVTALVLVQFRQQLVATAAFTGEIDLDEKKAIRDPMALKRALLALAVTLALFLVHHHLHLYPAYVTFVGVALALALLRPAAEDLLKQLEWPVLLFFAALFVIVGGVDSSGLLERIGHSLGGLSGDSESLLLTCLLLMWVAAFISAVVDNIPFTVTMIPIVMGLEGHGINITPMLWALALGVGLGGNGTHIGATANIICVTESERAGVVEARITPILWLRKGLPIMVFSLVLASGFFALFFDYFS